MRLGEVVEALRKNALGHIAPVHPNTAMAAQTYHTCEQVFGYFVMI